MEQQALLSVSSAELEETRFNLSSRRAYLAEQPSCCVSLQLSFCAFFSLVGNVEIQKKENFNSQL